MFGVFPKNVTCKENARFSALGFHAKNKNRINRKTRIKI
jgi:hypothetical protein